MLQGFPLLNLGSRVAEDSEGDERCRHVVDFYGRIVRGNVMTEEEIQIAGNEDHERHNLCGEGNALSSPNKVSSGAMEDR